MADSSLPSSEPRIVEQGQTTCEKRVSTTDTLCAMSDHEPQTSQDCAESKSTQIVVWRSKVQQKPRSASLATFTLQNCVDSILLSEDVDGARSLKASSHIHETGSTDENKVNPEIRLSQPPQPVFFLPTPPDRPKIIDPLRSHPVQPGFYPPLPRLPIKPQQLSEIHSVTFVAVDGGNLVKDPARSEHRQPPKITSSQSCNNIDQKTNETTSPYLLPPLPSKLSSTVSLINLTNSIGRLGANRGKNPSPAASSLSLRSELPLPPLPPSTGSLLSMAPPFVYEERKTENSGQKEKATLTGQPESLLTLPKREQIRGKAGRMSKFMERKLAFWRKDGARERNESHVALLPFRNQQSGANRSVLNLFRPSAVLDKPASNKEKPARLQS